MTPREFRARFRSLDEDSLDELWRVFIGADLPRRGDLVAALDRIESVARLDLYSARPHALA
jgi:hypothetical protein